MTLPTAYLTSRKRMSDIFEAIQTAQAPERFTQKFLETLDFKAKGDRLIINVLKGLGFLDDNGRPTQRYFEYLDQTQSQRVLAEGIKEAYSDLFSVNIRANELGKQELIGKLKTLSQGQYSDAVLSHMAGTFLDLVKLADFEAHKPKEVFQPAPGLPSPLPKAVPRHIERGESTTSRKLGGLVYNIQIVLPETRDQAVYDALFKSLRQHIE